MADFGQPRAMPGSSLAKCALCVPKLSCGVVASLCAGRLIGLDPRRGFERLLVPLAIVAQLRFDSPSILGTFFKAMELHPSTTLMFGPDGEQGP